MEKIKLNTLLCLTEPLSFVSIRNENMNTAFTNGEETFFEGKAGDVPYWLINREVVQIEPLMGFENDEKTFCQPMLVIYITVE